MQEGCGLRHAVPTRLWLRPHMHLRQDPGSRVKAPAEPPRKRGYCEWVGGDPTSPDYLQRPSPARPALLHGVWRGGQALDLKQMINTKLHSRKHSKGRGLSES